MATYAKLIWNTNDYLHNMTAGKTYQVEGESDGHIRLHDDVGRSRVLRIAHDNYAFDVTRDDFIRKLEAFNAQHKAPKKS